ncbi:sugar transporter [Neisseria flavescens]|uniref:Sugar efflux transporter n=1 Tax=Neisseria flavescens NRL30031/H210 TaxID=546264 RepID=C0EJS4_NEIFL|nr:sugar transporter [Neisseria flavescens]SPY03930.1 sugar efflux transporter [Neisseria meningitidis]EEG34547.1 sugar efflux transporter [Neisseria flavescens NRL30031/H210]QCL68829.1 sugar transporter [Neisseria flavescens]SPY10214.1 sugar efflux transporter [Neisseria meningitidis]STZ65184.1 sugar efflux transporter [Neisseria flavescens]
MTSTLKQWVSVCALAVGAFIFNTTEFIPIALLSDIGQSFGKAATEVGMMITVYAWIVALLSLPLMLMTKNIERRKLLLMLFALFALFHALSFFSWNFNILLVSRIGIALTHAVFWSITASLAVRLAPTSKTNQALGLLSTGTVLAMVLGIPLGRVVGQYFGWQLSFLLIGVCAAGVMLVLAKNLPALPSQNTGSLSNLPSLFKRRNLMLLYAMTVLIITAHFTAYSYIEPFVLQVGGFKAEQVTIVLSLYGLAGFAASYLFGKWFAKSQRLFMLGAVAVILLSALLLLPFASFPYAVYALVFIWGVAIVIVSLGMVSKVLAFASDATDVANSIYSGLYNVGIGGGALLGHYVTVWFGLSNIGIAGALPAAAGLAVCGLLFKEQDNLTQNV